MFKFEEICELVRLVGTTGVASVEVEHAGSRLRIEGPPQVPTIATSPVASLGPAVPVAPPAAPRPGAPVPPAAPDAAAEADLEEGLHIITSPIVGTFYRAPSPDADPYVKVGDGISKGQVLCIVEAMKLMNEIESDVAGTVVKIFPDNAQPVEFGQRLFAVRPD